MIILLKKIKNIFLDLMIVALILLIIIEITNRNKPINIFDYYLFYVKSGSMENTLCVGDYIIIKKSDNYNVGDIVTYKKDNGMYITHRIVSINDDKIITKGDANKVNDPEISREIIIGKLVFKSVFLNFIIKNKLIVILIIIILLLIKSIINNKKAVGANE